MAPPPPSLVTIAHTRPRSALSGPLRAARTCVSGQLGACGICALQIAPLATGLKSLGALVRKLWRARRLLLLLLLPLPPPASDLLPCARRRQMNLKQASSCSPPLIARKWRVLRLLPDNLEVAFESLDTRPVVRPGKQVCASFAADFGPRGSFEFCARALSLSLSLTSCTHFVS